MAVLDYVLDEEMARLQRFRLHLLEDIEKLPKGSIVIKIKAKRRYAYRTYRQGKKVISEYVGPAASPQAAQVGQLISERRKIAAEIKNVDASIARLRRVLNAW